MMYNSINTSVRQMVEFTLRSGSIDSTFSGSKRAVRGLVIHQKLQTRHEKITSKCGCSYESEYRLKAEIKYDDFDYKIEGRADAVIKINDTVHIEEIKSTAKDVEHINVNDEHWHWAQAKCYGYLYSMLEEIDEVVVHLTYCNIDSFAEKTFEKKYSKDEMKDFFYKILALYHKWCRLKQSLSLRRDKTAKNLDFPFGEFRKGQRKFCGAVYKTIYSQKKLFAQAPTGVGKTISALFPAIKYVAEVNQDNYKIFYLTAKNITRQVAEATITQIHKKGVYFKTIVLSAREKTCINDETVCTPEKCRYANGHFDRVNDALWDILNNEEIINNAVVKEYAEKHCVCPFELSLDVCLFSDLIICDYNYAFDPKAQLARFFSDDAEKGYYIALIDEAHNLVERARDMFSSELSYSAFNSIIEKVDTHDGYSFIMTSERIADCFRKLADGLADEDEINAKNIIPTPLLELLTDFSYSADKWLVSNSNHSAFNEILDLYFKTQDFLAISEFFDNRYVFITKKTSSDIYVKMLCLDPSFLLNSKQKKFKSSIFFSATLTPLEYFMEILGGNAGDNSVKLLSPYDRKNLCLLTCTSISTKYRQREKSYEPIADYLYEMTSAKIGNYFAFFPSYMYMNEIKNIFELKYSQTEILIQKSDMNEAEKKKFLEEFETTRSCSMLCFAVMGGAFSEGIDLVGSRLIGAAVIGVGLPLLNTERNIISNYYSRKNSRGFQYAYMYPGMNKVLQAAGRVIRTADDKGCILLIDERFKSAEYKRLFPLEWQHCINIASKHELKQALSNFWYENQ